MSETEFSEGQLNDLLSRARTDTFNACRCFGSMNYDEALRLQAKAADGLAKAQQMLSAFRSEIEAKRRIATGQ